jgi:hypothetical protein
MLPLTPEDQGAVDHLCRQQNQRDGTDYAPPRLYVVGEDGLDPNPNVALGFKVVRNGRIVQAHVFERSLELMTFGSDPRAMALSLKELPAAIVLLKRQKYEGFHTRIGRGFLDQWERSLVDRLRIKQDDQRLAHFYRPFQETR